MCPLSYRLPLALGYYTGMREGEIHGLRWEQVKFLENVVELNAGETKNDEGRTVPIIPQLRRLLLDRHAKRDASCPYVCYKLDRRGAAVRVRGFRKAWYSACCRSGLGEMIAKTDKKTGEPLYSTPRGPYSRPKVKTAYRGMIFHDLRRTGVRNLVRAGVPEKVAMTISGHLTRAVFERYNIISGADVVEAGRKLVAFHDQKVGDNSGTNAVAGAVSSPVVN